MPDNATIRDVAREANVSTTTVSRYFHESDKLSEEVKLRIRNAIDKTHYQPNLLARSLKSQRNNTISLIVPDICNPFYSLMVRAAARTAAENGYFLSFFNSDGFIENEKEALRLAAQQNHSGILYASVNFHPEVIMEHKKKSGIPLVGMNAYCEDFPFDLVHVETVGGTYLAACHLLNLGHRRIAFAGGTPGSMIESSRRNGFELAMRKNALAPQENMLFEMGFSYEDGLKAGRYFSTFSPLPTAICCANDQIALGVMESLIQLGISIPDDVSVTGMDDIPYANMLRPSLTTVTNDGSAFAEAAMRLLLERIEGKYTGESRKLAIPNRLIVRGSTKTPSEG